MSCWSLIRTRKIKQWWALSDPWNLESSFNRAWLYLFPWLLHLDPKKADVYGLPSPIADLQVDVWQVQNLVYYVRTPSGCPRGGGCYTATKGQLSLGHDPAWLASHAWCMGHDLPDTSSHSPVTVLSSDCPTLPIWRGPSCSFHAPALSPTWNLTSTGDSPWPRMSFLSKCIRVPSWHLILAADTFVPQMYFHKRGPQRQGSRSGPVSTFTHLGQQRPIELSLMMGRFYSHHSH